MRKSADASRNSLLSREIGVPERNVELILKLWISVSAIPRFAFPRRIGDVDSLTHAGSLEHGSTATADSRPVSQSIRPKEVFMIIELGSVTAVTQNIEPLGGPDFVVHMLVI